MSIDIDVGFRRPFVLGALAGAVTEVLGAFGRPAQFQGAVVLAKAPRSDTNWEIEPLFRLELGNLVTPEVTHFALVCGSPTAWVSAALLGRLDQPPWPDEVPERLDDEEYWFSQPGWWNVEPNRCCESAFLALVLVIALARLSDGWICNKSQVTVVPTIDMCWVSGESVRDALKPPQGESDPVGFVLGRSGYASYRTRPCVPS